MGMLIRLAIIVAGIWLFIKILPIILRFILYSILALPLLAILFIFVPGPVDEGGILLLLLVLAIARSGGSGFSILDHIGSGRSGSDYSDSSYSSGSSYDSYVLNKKTGVIHDRWDSSVDTISEHHRRSLSYTEAQDLVNRGTRYRFKRDP